MPVPATNDEFIDLVRKSGVADEAKLNAYVEKLKDSSQPVPPQPAKFAVWLVRDGLLTYFQAEQILQGKYKRFTIGKYKVLEKLGVGGMGQVFLCEHKMMRRRVAVKVLPLASSQEEAARERFYREARAVAALDHPNIVRAYDVDQDESLHFLVMEFVDGTNLHDLIKKHGVLAVDRACHYIYAAAAGLQYANSMGIVHRDIKPGNLLVDRTGVVKVLDMGLAKFFKDEDESLTRKHDENVLGTADYLAPEQAIDSHNVDIRADIYSLGGTFYYLLTGSAPFPEGNIAQKLMMHQSREPKPISLIRPEVPDGVIEIIDVMMKKNREDRYASPADLMTALAPYVQTPIPPPAEKEMPRLSRAAIGGATQTSSIGRAPPSGVLMTQSTSSGISFPGSNAGIGTTSSVIETRGTAVWEVIAQDTTDARKSDTAPVPEKVKEPSRRGVPVEVADSRKKKKLLIGGIVAVLALAGGLIAFLSSGKNNDAKQSGTDSSGAAPATGPKTLYVTKGRSTLPDVTFTTLAAALKKTNPGDTILIVDEVHEEAPLKVASSGAGKFKGVTIDAGNPAKRVRFKIPDGGNYNLTNRGVIEIIAADGLTLKNLTIDAGDRADFAVIVQDAVDGLVIENCTVRAARTAAIRLEKTFAIPAAPLVLQSLLIQVNNPNCSGLQILGTSTTSASNIQIHNCRFSGPGWNAIHITGRASEVDIRNNRIYKFENGIQFQGPDNNVQLKIVNNTFHTIGNQATGSVIWINGMPPNSPPPEIVFEQNYCANIIKEILRGPSRMPGLKAKNNGRDKDAKSGSAGDAKADEVKNYTMAPPSSDDDASFLRIEAGSPLKAFGSGKWKIGAQ